jgi:para-aminobenzoate synthetase component 1
MILDQDGRETRVSWATADAPCVGSGPDWLNDARQLLQRTPAGGGLVGWLGYEAGRWVERMPAPRAARPLPDIGLFQVEGFLELGPGGPQISGSPRFAAEARAVLKAAAQVEPAPQSTTTGGPVPAPAGGDAARWYPAAVATLLDHIRAGDCYQANLSWRCSAPPPSDPLATWLALRSGNPADWGAFLKLDDDAIVSNSPELYLSVAGDRIETRPIKGTARREDGERARRMLWESPKERAELTMVVDMARNDLGRVAVPGSVRASPRRLRPCGDLLHAEQPVTAQLRPGLDAFDAVRASFPPASVTGAPKVRAMELIHALEPEPRGVYTGALGWFDTGGRAALSVAIRTVTVAGRSTSFHLGAGIVADSQPQAEWSETLDKGRKLAAALR